MLLRRPSEVAGAKVPCMLLRTTSACRVSVRILNQLAAAAHELYVSQVREACNSIKPKLFKFSEELRFSRAFRVRRSIRNLGRTGQ